MPRLLFIMHLLLFITHLLLPRRPTVITVSPAPDIMAKAARVTDGAGAGAGGAAMTIKRR